jgi:hypothetical protein
MQIYSYQGLYWGKLWSVKMPLDLKFISSETKLKNFPIKTNPYEVPGIIFHNKDS